MLHFNLFNLILHNFLELKLTCVVIFHCWSKETLQQFSLISLQHQFYIQFVNLNDENAFDKFAYRYLRFQRPKMGVFTDMNCNQIDDFINQTSHLRLFNQRFHYLIYDKTANISRFKDIFKNVNLSVDTDMSYVVPKVTQISLHVEKTTFIKFDVYNNGWFIGGTLNITINYEIECDRMECRRTKYLSDLYKRSVYGNRDSLRDVTMRVAVVVTKYDLKAPSADINAFLLTQKDFHIDPLSRFGFQIFTILRESLYTNVSYEYHDRWTDVEYTGGVVGALVIESADLSATPFFMSGNRFRYLTPLVETGDFRSVCMFRTPRNSGIHGGVFLDPFSTKVWIIFGIILSLASMALWLTFFVEYHKMKQYIGFVPSLLTTCLISFGSACSQGSFLIPSSMGGRAAFISLSLITFIMYNYYTSIVVSSLLGSPVKSKIKTMGDLADSNLDIGLEPLPFTYTYLNFSTLPDIRRFVKRKIESKKNFESLWHSAGEGINIMRYKPGFVFIFEASTGYNLIEKLYDAHEICDLNEILFRSDTKLVSHVHKNSSYREIVRLKLLRILETGVHRKHRRQWARSSLNCLSNSFLISVGMEYAAPLFIMLSCAYISVFIILMLEILWHRYEMGQNNVGVITEYE